MVMVYRDRAGNRLHIGRKYIFVRNRQNKIVNKRGVMTMLRRANKAGKIRFRY